MALLAMPCTVVGPDATTSPGVCAHFPGAAPTSCGRPRFVLGSRNVFDAAEPTGSMDGLALGAHSGTKGIMGNMGARLGAGAD